MTLTLNQEKKTNRTSVRRIYLQTILQPQLMTRPLMVCLWKHRAWLTTVIEVIETVWRFIRESQCWWSYHLKSSLILYHKSFWMNNLWQFFTETKCLGLTIDNKLSRCTHISQQAKKLSTKQEKLHQMRSLPKLLNMVYLQVTAEYLWLVYLGEWVKSAHWEAWRTTQKGGTVHPPNQEKHTRKQKSPANCWVEFYWLDVQIWYCCLTFKIKKDMVSATLAIWKPKVKNTRRLRNNHRQNYLHFRKCHTKSPLLIVSVPCGTNCQLNVWKKSRSLPLRR